MTAMKRTGALLIIGAALALAGTAQASSTSWSGPQSLAPTSHEIAVSLQAAAIYWHATPPCGQPTIVLGPLAVAAGEALLDSCQIVFAEQNDWVDFPSMTCQDTVHEYGHLVLGPLYFQAVNPTDPAHSSDPNSIMFWEPRVGARLAREVGCPLGEFAPQPLLVVGGTHHRHRHRHRARKPTA